MRVKGSFTGAIALLGCVVIALTFPVSARAQSVTPEDAILSAMRLWGDIRYLDPRTVGQRVPSWDMDWADTEPQIRAATDRASYSAAIDRLFSLLKDPASHLDRPSRFQPAVVISPNGSVSVVTISNAARAEADKDIDASLNSLAESKAILFDLRGFDYANASAMSSLDEMFSPDSPLSTLVRGDFELPRTRTRSYSGYPAQDSGFAGYSAQFDIADPRIVHGTAPEARRIGFLVDRRASVTPTILGLALSGNASIYTTDGQPMIEATRTASIGLEYGLTATYRLGDILGIDPGDAVATPVQSIADAISRMSQPAVALHIERRDLESEIKFDPFGRGNLFPDEGLRTLAVARVYNVIRYFSPYASIAHDDWDAAAKRAISDELAARNTQDYLLGLMRFFAHLHDSHGFVVGDMVNEYYGAGVPVALRYLRRQAVVTAIGDPAGVPASMRVGDVVDAIDRVPTRRAMLQAETLINASTPQEADLAALRNHGAGSLLAGPVGSKVTLRFHSPGSTQEMSATLIRKYGAAVEKRAEPIYTILPGNVGYVDLDRLEPDEVDGMFTALWNTDAIVFDNRGYPREAAPSIASRLARQPRVAFALFSTPLVRNPIDSTEGDVSWLPSRQDFLQTLSASERAKYHKPTVMLIDARSISQSEHSALMFRAAAGTRFVGTPTAGADGDITTMILPSGLTLYFSGQGVRYPNGKQLQRVGVQPDRWAEPSAFDVAESNDVVLQAGLDEAMRASGFTPATRRAAVRAEKVREIALAHGGLETMLANAPGNDDRALQLNYKLLGDGFAAETTAAGGNSGGSTYSIQSLDGAKAAPMGSYAGSFNIAPYLGKTIRVRGYLTSNDVVGAAGFWVRIDGPSEQLDNMNGRWLHGTTPWKRFTIVLRVPADATHGVAGILLRGSGKVRASDVRIDIVPDSTSTTEVF